MVFLFIGGKKARKFAFLGHIQFNKLNKRLYKNVQFFRRVLENYPFDVWKIEVIFFSQFFISFIATTIRTKANIELI